MKKLDKIALIVGISSLVFALGFGTASCVTAYRTFKDNGGGIGKFELLVCENFHFFCFSNDFQLRIQ